MAEEDVHYDAHKIIQSDIPSWQEDPQKIADLEERKDLYEKHFNETIKALHHEGDMVDIEIYDFTQTKAKEWLYDRFSKLGVEDSEITFPTAIISTDIPKAPNGEARPGGTYPGIGIMLDEKYIDGNIEDKDLAEYMKARIVLEEMYHFSAMQRISLSPTHDKYGDVSGRKGLERQGLGFYKKTPSGDIVGYGNALEEGLAQKIMAEAHKTILKESFPEGHRKYKEILEKNNKEGYPDITSYKDGHAEFSRPYESPTMLVDEVVDNALGGDIGELERARLKKGGLIELGRKIKKTYGEENFRKIMSATQESAMMTASVMRIARNKKASESEN